MYKVCVLSILSCNHMDSAASKHISFRSNKFLGAWVIVILRSNCWIKSTELSIQVKLAFQNIVVRNIFLDETLKSHLLALKKNREGILLLFLPTFPQPKFKKNSAICSLIYLMWLWTILESIWSQEMNVHVFLFCFINPNPHALIGFCSSGKEHKVKKRHISLPWLHQPWCRIKLIWPWSIPS